MRRREYVQHDGTDNPHQLIHQGANCFTDSEVNPQRIGGVATQGEMWDEHTMYPSVAPRLASYCQADQVYQQAYAYPTPPNYLNDAVPPPYPGWQDMSSHILMKRWIETNPDPPPAPAWRYRITKAGEVNTWPLP